MMKVNRADESQSCLRICKMTIDMVREVSDLHMNAFKGSMNTRLGNVYLQRFFDWFVRLEHGISLVGILKTAETEQIVGYVVGAPLDYGKALNRDLFWVAAWNTVIRPWLFLNRQFRENVSARIGSFGKTSKVPSFQVELPAPAMSLVGLAILPSFQGKGFGKKMLRAFEDQAGTLQVRSLRLSVFPENSAARCAYEKCGWLPYESVPNSGKAMHYYKILPKKEDKLLDSPRRS